MNTLKCPYCDKQMNDPDDCREPEHTYEYECPHCDKAFRFTLDYSIHFYPEKADCLNEAEHDWRESTTYPKEYTRLICEGCHREKAISPERRAQLKAEDEAGRNA